MVAGKIAVNALVDVASDVRSTTSTERAAGRPSPPGLGTISRAGRAGSIAPEVFLHVHVAALSDDGVPRSTWRPAQSTPFEAPKLTLRSVAV